MHNRTGLVMLVLVAAVAGVAHPAWAGCVIHVWKVPSCSDANDGCSWEAPKCTVQAGLQVAGTGDQVWVAVPAMPGAPDRYVECISLRDGVELYGGFAGNETDLSQRDWNVNKTILDGNQQAWVVYAPEGVTSAARIDGFTITNGNARYGGGIYCLYSFPTIANNTITGNTATHGGGIHCDASPSTIENNVISDNVASGDGGGIFCWYCSPRVNKNNISGNSAAYGGGVYCKGSSPPTSPTIADCRLEGNEAANAGGGAYLEDAPTRVVNSIFVGNRAHKGGGISNEGGYPSPEMLHLVNCTFSGNRGEYGGGGLWTNPAIKAVNCTFSRNSAGGSDPALHHGGGVSLWDNSPIQTPYVLTNCIFRGNTDDDPQYTGEKAQIYPTTGVNAVVNHSSIEGCTVFCADPNDCNIGDNPLFADADGPDDIVGTEDDDLRLSPGSPCIDAGKNLDDLCNGVDLDGKPRCIDDPASADCRQCPGQCGEPAIVDMGAYEYHDCNGNGIPDACDLDCGEPGGPCDVPGCGQSLDCNGNGIPDECDVQPKEFTGLGLPIIYSYVGSTPSGLDTCDLDRDGHRDLIIVLTAGSLGPRQGILGAVSVRLNDGAGAFPEETWRMMTGGASPRNVTCGDWDGDGWLDLAVINDQSAADPSSADVSIFRNRGKGDNDEWLCFDPPILVPVPSPGYRGYGIASADLDRDGDLDLVAGTFTPGGNGTVCVLRNTGNGFEPKECYDVGGGAYSPVAGDLTGDGFPDIAVANYGSSTVSVLINRGDGTFDAPVSWSVAGYTFSVAIADLDRDGDLDVAASIYYPPPGRVSVLLNRGGGACGPWLGFDPALDYPEGGTAPTTIAAADLEGDDDSDLVIANYYSDYVSILMNNGDGTFGPPLSAKAPTIQVPITAADLNGDRHPDVAVGGYPSGSDYVTVLTNLTWWYSQDCNQNGVPDECDISDGASPDRNGNGIPDECELHLVSASSRMTHYCVDHPTDFDIPLGITDDCEASGIESRVLVQPDYGMQVRLTCNEAIMALACNPDCSMIRTSCGACDSVSIEDNVLIVHLKEIIDQSFCTLSVEGVADLQGNPLVGDNDVTFRTLLGDVTGDGVVNIEDLQRCKKQLFKPVAPTNFRCDVDRDCVINIEDLNLVKLRLFSRVMCP